MNKLKLLEEFIRELLKTSGLKEVGDFKLNEDDLGYQISSDILQKINDFLYVEDLTCGKNPENSKEFISKFHKFWKENHEKIINPVIDEQKCFQVAQILENIHTSCGSQLLSTRKILFTIGNIDNLTPQQIANVRFFTIIQDFKIKFRVDPYPLAIKKPELFDAKSIIENYPALTDELLHLLGADTQTDKRHKFARLSAELLVEKYGGDAFNICKMHQNDVLEIRKALVENPNPKFKQQLGFSDKKANLLIRDLVAMDIWNVKNPEEIDVSSDANTMRLALRTGILKIRAPLLTSYLDIYGYQYALIDQKTKLAWRKVWDIWGTFPSNHRVKAPAFFDFLIYRIGQTCCKTKTRRCDIKCSWHRLENCDLKQNMLTNCDGKCAFAGVCDSNTKDLNPPRAISVLGGTGWEDGRTTAQGGGKGISA